MIDYRDNFLVIREDGIVIKSCEKEEDAFMVAEDMKECDINIIVLDNQRSIQYKV